jgi:hypothetical protein
MSDGKAPKKEVITNESQGLGPCEGGCGSQGYADWELGPDDGSTWCITCVNKTFPLKGIPQEWMNENAD